VREDEVRAFARWVSAFYARTGAARSGAEQRTALAAGAADDRRALTSPEAGLDRALVERVTGAVARTLEARGDLLDPRRIVEGHGDLRPEHVSLGPPPAAIDCLEFDRDLRLVDPVDELAFLALECRRLGAPAVGEWILDEYTRFSGDAPAPALVAFYKAYRACRRAKLAVWHLRDHGRPPHDADRWRGRAARYLELGAAALA
jgi:aminoglycoside phosphotransferase family enzyme